MHKTRHLWTTIDIFQHKLHALFYFQRLLKPYFLKRNIIFRCHSAERRLRYRAPGCHCRRHCDPSVSIRSRRGRSLHGQMVQRLERVLQIYSQRTAEHSSVSTTGHKRWCKFTLRISNCALRFMAFLASNNSLRLLFYNIWKGIFS